MKKLVDLRTVIGVFFLIIGLLLLGYSFTSSFAIQSHSEINRWCGGIFTLFGGGMLLSLLFANGEE